MEGTKGIEYDRKIESSLDSCYVRVSQDLS